MSEHILNSVGFRIGLVVISALLPRLLLPEVRAQIPQRVITTDAESAMSVHAADLNGDGAVDVLSASLADDKIAWYENQIGEAGADSDGFGSQQTITTSADGAQSVYATDLDGDGDQDILTAAPNGDKIAWYENQIDPGGDRDGFGREQVVTTSAETAYSVFAADLDDDGDADVLSASSFDDTVAWYENQIGEGGADGDGFGPEQVITASADGAASVYATDLDGDGDADVVSASSYDDMVAWYENQLGEGGADRDGFDSPRTITTGATYAASVFAADLDGDGDADVLSASRSDDRIAWYENQIGEGGSDEDGFGTQETITTDADEAQSVYAADLNGSGRVDVLSASTNDDKVAWYANTDGTLPVELVAFEGQWRGDGAVALTWQTASETNNATFQILRKVAGKMIGESNSPVQASRRNASTDSGWTTVGEVEGAGTTANPQRYRYFDTDLPFTADSLSYRLRQVDVDGTAHLAETITIGRAVKRLQLRAVYPNPARNRVTVRFAVPDRRKVALRVHDVLGREVRTVVEARAEGRHKIQFDVSTLPSGTYFLRLTAGPATQTERLTITR